MTIAYYTQMSKKSIPDEEDSSFAELFGDAKPIKHHKQRLRKPKTKPLNLPPRPQKTHIEPQFEQAIAPDANLFFARDGLQTKLIRALKQGKLTIDGELDLHGMNWQSAEEALDEFLNLAKLHHYRVLLIIPGKGHVLKSALNYYLRNKSQVLAFCTAKPKHGGTGSLYTLIGGKR